MTKLVFIPALLAILAFGSVAPLRAHDSYRIIGTVKVMDVTKSLLVVETKNGVVQIDVYEDTPIWRDKKRVPRSELKPGRSVVVEASGDNYSELEVQKVTIIPALPK